MFTISTLKFDSSRIQKEIYGELQLKHKSSYNHLSYFLPDNYYYIQWVLVRSNNTKVKIYL